MPVSSSAGCTPDSIRVGVATAEPIVAEGLALLLDADPFLSCESATGDLVSALGLLENGKVEALVLDETLLDMASLGALTDGLLRGSSARVVVLTSEQSPVHGVLASALGARGRRVDKSTGASAVIEALYELFGSSPGDAKRSSS